MKKLLIILIIALGMFHSIVDINIDSFEYKTHQNERVESQIDDEVFLIVENKLPNAINNILLKPSSEELSSNKESQIWKPPVNS